MLIASNVTVVSETLLSLAVIEHAVGVWRQHLCACIRTGEKNFEHFEHML